MHNPQVINTRDQVKQRYKFLPTTAASSLEYLSLPQRADNSHYGWSVDRAISNAQQCRSGVTTITVKRFIGRFVTNWSSRSRLVSKILDERICPIESAYRAVYETYWLQVLVLIEVILSAALRKTGAVDLVSKELDEPEACVVWICPIWSALVVCETHCFDLSCFIGCFRQIGATDLVSKALEEQICLIWMACVTVHKRIGICTCLRIWSIGAFGR